MIPALTQGKSQINYLPEVGHDLAPSTNSAVETWLHMNICLTKLTLPMSPNEKKEVQINF
jgi:hypothetical protein